MPGGGTFDFARKCASLRHARTSRGRNRPPRPRARHGGPAHRRRARRAPRSEAPAAPPISRKRLTGRTVTAVGRRAKYLTIDLDDGGVLLAHLGMSGRMIVDENGPDARSVPPSRGSRARHVRARQPDLRALRRSPALRDDGLGRRRRAGGAPADRASRPRAHRSGIRRGPAVEADRGESARRSRRPCSTSGWSPGWAISMSARACSRSGISPRRLAANVGPARAGRLARAIQETLASAIDAGGSSLRDHVAPDGELGYFQHRFKVYGREGERCPGCDCGGAVRRIVQSGRSTFYCAARQR